MDDVEKALEYIDPNIPRDDWVRVAMALKSEYGDAGLTVFDNWSQSGESYNKAALISTWKSIHVNGGVRIATLFHMAKQGGYTPKAVSEAELHHIREERRRKAEQIQREYLESQVAKTQNHERVAEQAQQLWAAAEPADPRHEYLATKAVKPSGLRQKDGILLLPLQDSAGRIWNLQSITAQGDKRFLPGSRKKGLYFPILGEGAGTVVICEGFATGATLAEATGFMVACAMDCGNMLPVAKLLREKHPDADIVIAADNDRQHKTNPGVTKALNAAQAVGARVVIPEIPEGASGTDFNDLLRHKSLDEIRDIVEQQEYVPEGAQDAHQSDGEDLSGAQMQCLADIQPEPVTWLWPGKIALGKVSLMAGDPGLGKSIITAALAAVVSRGGRWPMDSTPCPQGSVVMLSAEDDAADTIRPRLDAAGADVSRVFILTAIHDTGRDGKTVQRAFSLDRDLEQLDRLLAQKPDTRLVSVDPVSAYMGAADTHNNSEVRAVLAQLATVAARHKVAVVAITHLNKSAQLNAMYRATGSLAFVAAARAVFAVTKDPSESARRLLLPVKNNLGDDRTGYAYQIATAENGAPVLAWEPEPVETTLEELAQMVAERKPRPVQQAVSWLQDLLADGPRLQTEIEGTAEDAGHSSRTLFRAKRRLGVVSNKRFDKKWEWALPATDPTVSALKEAAQADDFQECQPPAVTEVATLKQSGNLSETEECHKECQLPPITKVATFGNSGNVKGKNATSGKGRHICNREKVAPLVATLDTAKGATSGKECHTGKKDTLTPSNPALIEAAQKACAGLSVTPTALIDALDPDDYTDIISDPALARYMAEQLEATTSKSFEREL